MLLVFHDKFTKWTEMTALRKATTETTKQALREKIIARFGVPRVLITDNGPQFTSRSFIKFLKELGIEHRLTAPYTPQENPTERMNRTLKTMIAQFAGENQQHWDELLPELSLAINTSVATSTGYSPAYLVQGRELRLPKTLYNETTPGPGRTPVVAEQMAESLQELFKLVQRNLATASSTQARHYNLRRRKWRPNIGDLVMVKTHHLSNAADHFAAKLAPRFEGPYKVINFPSPVIVTLEGTKNQGRKRAHLSDLKPYHAHDESTELEVEIEN